jgi:hypothetical protein
MIWFGTIFVTLIRFVSAGIEKSSDERSTFIDEQISAEMG